LAKLYYYDGGQTIAEFRRGGAGDWFVWAPKRDSALPPTKQKRSLWQHMPDPIIPMVDTGALC
jgi:hypothetical protein